MPHNKQKKKNSHGGHGKPHQSKQEWKAPKVKNNNNQQKPSFAKSSQGKPAHTMDGVISVNAKGIGYVRPLKKGSAFEKVESVEIPAEKLNTALQGDQVRITTRKGGGG